MGADVPVGLGSLRVRLCQVLADGAQDPVHRCARRLGQWHPRQAFHEHIVVRHVIMGVVVGEDGGHRHRRVRPQQPVDVGLLPHHIALVEEQRRLPRGRDAEDEIASAGAHEERRVELAGANRLEAHPVEPGTVAAHEPLQHFAVELVHVTMLPSRRTLPATIEFR